MKKVFFIILSIILFALVLNFFSKNQVVSTPLEQTSDQNSPNQENSSQLAFQEITIPFLRQRSYKSQLSELEEVARNNNYVSYLTSYDSDGLKIEGLLTQPLGEIPEGGWPAIVFIHGYIPPTIYRTREKYIEYVDSLADNGFVVFKIDLRGHGNSEGDPGGAYYSSDYIIDALNAKAALESSSFVNPSRIGFWGHSMSGNVVLRALASQPDIKAAVIWGGAVFSYEDMRQYGLNDNSYRPPSTDTNRQQRRRQLFDAHGEFEPNNPFWATVSPTNYLEDLKGAIQLHHAVNDDVVNVGYSRDLAKKLVEEGVNHEFHEYPTGGHNITSPSFNIAMQRTIEFFKQKLSY